MKIGRREFLGIAGALALGSAVAVYSKGEASPLKKESSQIIEGGDEEKTQTPEKEERIEIILTGDVMLGRTVTTESLDKQKNPAHPFRKVVPTLKEADLVFVNLENPIVKDCPRTYEGLRFCAPPEMLEGLSVAEVDIVTLANNHAGNYGTQGLEQTVKYLNERNIAATGRGELVTKEVKGVKFGFLGLDYSSIYSPTFEDYDLVSESKPKVDVLIVGIHWSGEYYSEPTEIQRRDARRLIEAGADVIAGQGPHWVIDKEYIYGKPVYYSLGNFVFDQMWSEETRRGLAVKLIFQGAKLIGDEHLPIYIDSWAQPEFVEPTVTPEPEINKSPKTHFAE
ncbi:MAG: CapA family protein [Patescibacteria group bacterium]